MENGLSDKVKKVSLSGKEKQSLLEFLTDDARTETNRDYLTTKSLSEFNDTMSLGKERRKKGAKGTKEIAIQTRSILDEGPRRLYNSTQTTLTMKDMNKLLSAPQTTSVQVSGNRSPKASPPTSPRALRNTSPLPENFIVPTPTAGLQ